MSNNITTIEHKPLHCPLCNERFMNILGQPMPSHTQIRCYTTAGNEMDIGICEACIELGVSLETVNAVLEGIKIFWCFEIDANTQMTEDEKTARKDMHNSHNISEIIKIIHTGKNAEQDARKRNLLE